MQKIEIITISEKDRDWYNTQYSKHNAVGFMKEYCNNGDCFIRIILKMKPGHRGWTPFGAARDCGDHYIIARYSRYDRVDKKTLKVTIDVEDK